MLRCSAFLSPFHAPLPTRILFPEGGATALSNRVHTAVAGISMIPFQPLHSPISPSLRESKRFHPTPFNPNYINLLGAITLFGKNYPITRDLIEAKNEACWAQNVIRELHNLQTSVSKRQSLEISLEVGQRALEGSSPAICLAGLQLLLAAVNSPQATSEDLSRLRKGGVLGDLYTRFLTKKDCDPFVRSRAQELAKILSRPPSAEDPMHYLNQLALSVEEGKTDPSTAVVIAEVGLKSHDFATRRAAAKLHDVATEVLVKNLTALKAAVESGYGKEAAEKTLQNVPNSEDPELYEAISRLRQVLRNNTPKPDAQPRFINPDAPCPIPDSQVLSITYRCVPSRW